MFVPDQLSDTEKGGVLGTTEIFNMFFDMEPLVVLRFHIFKNDRTTKNSKNAKINNLRNIEWTCRI